jgi:hypothetical protein
MIITQSDASEDAVRQFEASMDKLRRLDVADGYIQQLKEVETLRYLTFLYLGMIGHYFPPSNSMHTHYNDLKL